MADLAVLHWRRAGREITVSVRGEVDSFNADGLFETIEQVAATLGDGCLVVDLMGVTFCGAAGARAIARLAGALQGTRGLRFAIASGGCVDRLLTLTELRESLRPFLVIDTAGREPADGPRRTD